MVEGDATMAELPENVDVVLAELIETGCWMSIGTGDQRVARPRRDRSQNEGHT